MGNDVGELWFGWKIEFKRTEKDDEMEKIIRKMRAVYWNNKQIDELEAMSEEGREKLVEHRFCGVMPERSVYEGNVSEDQVDVWRKDLEERRGAFYDGLYDVFEEEGELEGVDLYRPYETDDLLVGVKVEDAYNCVEEVKMEKFEKMRDEARKVIGEFVKRHELETYCRGSMNVLVVGRYS